jgi:hypothetical protein
MCCLGYYGLACGLSPEQLMNNEGPTECSSWNSSLSSWLFDSISLDARYKSSEDCSNLMGYNDDEDIDDETREAKIIAIFAKHDIQVEFV